MAAATSHQYQQHERVETAAHQVVQAGQVHVLAHVIAPETHLKPHDAGARRSLV